MVIVLVCVAVGYPVEPDCFGICDWYAAFVGG